MNDSIGFLLLIQVILIALNAVFASAEIAVLSVNELRLAKLAEQGDRRALRLSRLTVNPAKFLATIQVAITLSGFLGSAFAADNFSDSMTDWLLGLGVAMPRETLETISVVLITLILSYFTLIFGELVPKRIAMKKAESLSLALSGLICGIAVLCTPLVWLLSVSTNTVLRLVGIDPDEDPDEVSEEGIRMMVDAGSEKGAIDHEEKEFIQNVFEFDDLTAGEIATHRTDTVFLSLEDDMEVWDRTIHDTRHTLYPVCEDFADNVTGILNAKDYFRLEDHSREAVLAGAVKPAYFVPDTIKADVLFRNMKQARMSMAVVLDAYGGMVGIITRNDLVEQLVGELGDEVVSAPANTPSIRETEPGKWLIRGNVDLEDIDAALGTDFEDRDFDTFTGLVFDRLGMVPVDGSQSFTVQVDSWAVRITRIEKHQIAEAIVEKRASEE